MSFKIFLCGDVMLGRGVDQVMPHPGKSEVREPYVRDAREYVQLAITRNGPIPRLVDFRYVWGDALTQLERLSPDFRIINLETSVTVSDSSWLGKEIHYRMHPANISCLQEAKVDCAVLANNHTLDFGYEGLSETLATLAAARIKTTGVGETLEQASAPAVLSRGEARLLVYACGHSSSGIPAEWAAGTAKPGLNLLPDFSNDTLSRIKGDIAARKQPGDRVVLSIHWGSNWGYEIDDAHRQFAHRLIDEVEVDVIHGHSSHHVRAIEIYRDKLILFGCGDFIDDYEGISGYESYHSDLKLMYHADLNPGDGTLRSLKIIPMQMRRFRLQRAGSNDAQWLCELLNREGEKLGARFDLTSQNELVLA